jgi:MOSC domain-containing protein YiiM
MDSKIFQINIKPNTKNERGLPKMAVNDAFITKLGLKGDHNNFRSTKKADDPDMAVLIITQDIIDELNNEGWPIKPGDLGENLTITGLDYKSIKPGQILDVGSAKIEISFICEPCTNLRVLSYVGNEKVNTFIKTMMNRRGWYSKVLRSGKVSKNDKVSLSK